jgi:hypothetical protein
VATPPRREQFKSSIICDERSFKNIEATSAIWAHKECYSTVDSLNTSRLPSGFMNTKSRIPYGRSFNSPSSTFWERNFRVVGIDATQTDRSFA